MIQAVQWLLTMEVVAVAFLPAAVWLMRWLPDRGYGLTKVLGLVLLTYGVWLLGSAAPVASSIWLAVIVVVAGGALSWWFGGTQALRSLRPAIRLVVIEEALFVVAFALWCVLRAQVFDPSIVHTEQFMDMGILIASQHSASYPPFDPWMSGHAINYYYVGYLMYGLVTRLSAVPPEIGYNLALSTLFALTVTGGFSIGYALTRRLVWSFLSPLFLALVGNWHAILWQIPHAACGGTSGGTFWGLFWNSTRVIGGHFTLLDWACGRASAAQSDYTINEFPLFSFVLGDLHPHVMALPITLLAIALGLSALAAPRPLTALRNAGNWGYLLLLAVCVGILFTVNSWDFPTYGLLLAVCIVANAYIKDSSRDWWRRPLPFVVALGIASVALYVPFYLHFKSLAHGIGLVSSRTDLYEFIQVFGLFILGAGLVVVSLGLLLQPAEEIEEVDAAISREPVAQLQMALGPVATGAWDRYLLPGVAFVAVAVFGLVLQRWTLLIILTLGIGAVAVLGRVLNTARPNRGDSSALLLVALACLVVGLTEIIYLRDAFDGGASYRMNTVFKFYYQAWTLLALAAAYGAYRSWRILRVHFGSVPGAAAAGALLLGTLAAGLYTVQVPSASVGAYGVHSLDGMAWIQRDHPGDYASILWLRRHAAGAPVELEGTGGGYTYAARISTFSGLPTVMGWADHEGQWRGADSEIEQRVTDVRTIYTTRDAGTARRLLELYNVRYAVVGDEERQLYSGGAPLRSTFTRFMRVAFRSGGTTVYTW